MEEFNFPKIKKTICDFLSEEDGSMTRKKVALRKNLCKFNNSDKKRYCERLEKQPLIFLQYTINTVICQGSSTVSLLEWSVAEWKQTDRAGSAQSVGVHDLQLAKNSAPVSQRHRPLLCNLVGCQIQSL